jgi:hypothetical protein
MEHRDEASSLRRSPKGEDDGVRPSRRGERQSSFQGVARNDDGESDTVGERSQTPSCSDQHPFRRPPQRLFLPIPGRERIPCMQTFSSCVSSNEKGETLVKFITCKCRVEQMNNAHDWVRCKRLDHGIVKWKCEHSIKLLDRIVDFRPQLGARALRDC